MVILALKIECEFGLEINIGLKELGFQYVSGPRVVRGDGGMEWRHQPRAHNAKREREREMCVYVRDSLPCRLPSSPTATHRAPGGRPGTPPGS